MCVCATDTRIEIECVYVRERERLTCWSNLLNSYLRPYMTEWVTEFPPFIHFSTHALNLWHKQSALWRHWVIFSKLNIPEVLNKSFHIIHWLLQFALNYILRIRNEKKWIYKGSCSDRFLSNKIFVHHIKHIIYDKLHILTILYYFTLILPLWKLSYWNLHKRYSEEWPYTFLAKTEWKSRRT